MSCRSAPYLHDQALAHEFVESVLWQHGPARPHCGGLGRITKVKANPEKRIRVGLWRCGVCKKQFTVKVGTIFEDSKISCEPVDPGNRAHDRQREGTISAHQLHRTLESNLQDRLVHGTSASVRQCAPAISRRVSASRPAYELGVELDEKKVEKGATDDAKSGKEPVPERVR